MRTPQKNAPRTVQKIALTLLLSLPCLSAFGGMRCGNSLISEGDDFSRVEELCGVADATYDMGSRVVYQEVTQGAEKVAIAESIKLDVWVYKLDKNTFRRKLHFENGILVKIELGPRT